MVVRPPCSRTASPWAQRSVHQRRLLAGLSALIWPSGHRVLPYMLRVVSVLCVNHVGQQHARAHARVMSHWDLCPWFGISCAADSSGGVKHTTIGSIQPQRIVRADNLAHRVDGRTRLHFTSCRNIALYGFTRVGRTGAAGLCVGSQCLCTVSPRHSTCNLGRSRRCLN